MQPTPQVIAIPDPELTLYVLLAGVLGGLLLALIVMVCCRVCLPKKKPLTRQHVVFSRSSEREERHASSSRARKYHSLDSSVSADIESSWGQFSDSSPSPREPKEFSPEQVVQRHNTTSSSSSPRRMSPRCLADIPENKTPEEEQAAASDVQKRKLPEGRRRSSTGIQRQASVCLSDGEEEATFLPPTQTPSHASTSHQSSSHSQKQPQQQHHRQHPHPQHHHHHHRHQYSEAEDDEDDLPHSLNLTQVSAVVHRSGNESSHQAASAALSAREGSPDALTSGSRGSCRNSRSSQGSHSVHSSLDSGSVRTVVAASAETTFSNGDYRRVQEPETRSSLQASFHRRSCRLHSAVDLEEYSYARRLHRHSTGSLPLLRERSLSSLDGEGWTEIPTPLREAGSTELGLLERGLEAHLTKRLGITRTDDDDDDTVCTVKRPVRYNDTGSREEIREDISSSPEEEMDEEVENEEEEIDDTEEHERLRLEYRLLWQLRATLEEEEELSDTLRLEDEEEDEEEDEDRERATELEAGGPAPLPKGTSPEKETASSHTASFDSNTAAADDVAHVITDKVYSNLLSLPSADSRRSSYVSRASKRLKRSAPGSTEGQNSFDSSVSTEWSSTDASRASTSFESSTTTTTDNTDSTAESQTRKLQQMKADSGYKSMESTEHPPPHPHPGHEIVRLRGRAAPEGDSIEEADETLLSSKEESLDLPDVTAVSQEEADKKEEPPIVITIIDETLESKTKRSFLRQSRKTEAEILSPTGSASPGQIPQEVLGKMSVFQRFFRSSRPPKIERLIRDYSIDEKTDCLFREFSRQDPGLEADQQRAWSASWRQSHFRLHHHAHHPHHLMHRRIDQDDDVPSPGSKAVLSPQLSIEEESDIESKLMQTNIKKSSDVLMQESGDWASATALILPVIRLPEEDIL